MDLRKPECIFVIFYRIISTDLGKDDGNQHTSQSKQFVPHKDRCVILVLIQGILAPLPQKGLHILSDDIQLAN